MLAAPRSRGHPVFEAIASALDLLCPRVCFRCQRTPEESAALCRRCLAGQPAPEPPAIPNLDACAAGAGYTGEVEAWVRAFKYPPATLLPDPAPEAMLGALLDRAARSLPEPALVVPVPLHPRRLRSRGFNPAGLLARQMAKRMEVPFDPVALVRLRDTPSQTGLDARARRRNVARAFRWVRAGTTPERVWLVDDVVTTGATLGAAARALHAAGVREVFGVCAAATERRG